MLWFNVLERGFHRYLPIAMNARSFFRHYLKCFRFHLPDEKSVRRGNVEWFVCDANCRLPHHWNGNCPPGEIGSFGVIYWVREHKQRNWNVQLNRVTTDYNCMWRRRIATTEWVLFDEASVTNSRIIECRLAFTIGLIISFYHFASVLLFEWQLSANEWNFQRALLFEMVPQIKSHAVWYMCMQGT